MKNPITCAECWGYDVFDIAIRRVQQLDRGMYPANIIYRVLMESDFAVNTIYTTLSSPCFCKTTGLLDLYIMFSTFIGYLCGMVILYRQLSESLIAFV
jgi:hypothetical protein